MRRVLLPAAATCEPQTCKTEPQQGQRCRFGHGIGDLVTHDQVVDLERLRTRLEAERRELLLRREKQVDVDIRTVRLRFAGLAIEQTDQERARDRLDDTALRVVETVSYVIFLKSMSF